MQDRRTPNKATRLAQFAREHVMPLLDSSIEATMLAPISTEALITSTFVTAKRAKDAAAILKGKIVLTGKDIYSMLRKGDSR